MTRVFISYSHKDKEFVERLVSDLENAGLAVFYDQRISVAESFIESLSDAIDSAQFVLVVLSPDYLRSQWTQLELQTALLREIDKTALVIPLMLQPCQLSGFIATKKYAVTMVDSCAFSPSGRREVSR